MAAGWYDLVKAEDLKRHIVHELADGTVIRYQSVRAGCSFPAEAPGAFCIVGLELDDQLESSPTPLTLLDEGLIQSPSLDAFWSAVSDSVVACCASPLYLPMSDEPGMDVFYDYKSRNNVNIDIAAAPWPDRFRLGLGVALDWFKQGRLVLHPDSLVGKELRSIEQSALGDKPEGRWPLTNSLRYVLSGFRKFPPAKPFEPGKYASDRPRQGWMV